MQNTKYNIQVYTDGACRNTGTAKGCHVNESDKSAYGFLIRRNGKKYVLIDGTYGATNNRMELTAVAKALAYIVSQTWHAESICITTDSKYISDAINKGWLNNWLSNGFKNSNKKPVANSDLWQIIADSLELCPNVVFEWTKGHEDNAGNNYVDNLLNQKMDSMPDKLTANAAVLV